MNTIKVSQLHPNQPFIPKPTVLSCHLFYYYFFLFTFCKTANKRMVRLRNNIISILNSSSPNYDTARTYTGQFLHMYQSFYSNTDWVELLVWLNYIALMPDAPLFPYTDLGKIIITGCIKNMIHS